MDGRAPAPLPVPLKVVAPLLALVVLLAAGCRSIASPQGWSAPVPVANSTTILTSLHKGTLSLVDTSVPGGATKWQFPPSTDKKTKLQGVYGTPVVDGDNVIFGAYNGHVYALKLADGSMVWDTNTGSAIVGGVALSGSTVFAGNSDGLLVALNAADGKQVGSYNTGEKIWSTPVVDGDTLYLTSMNRKAYAFTISSFNGTNPKPLWQHQVSSAAITATPTIANGEVLVGTFDRHVYALNASTGAQNWRSEAAQNWFWSKALVANGTAYLGSLDGNVYAFDAASGAEKWHSHLGDSIRSEPVIVQGTLVVTDRKGHMAGFNPDTGQQLWAKDLNSTTLGNLVAFNQNVLVATEASTAGSQLLQISPSDGGITVLQKG